MATHGIAVSAVMKVEVRDVQISKNAVLFVCVAVESLNLGSEPSLESSH